MLNTFYYQLTHITLKNVELLKHSKINKNAPTCFGIHGNHLQGVKVSTRLKVTRLVNSRCVKDAQGVVSAMAAYILPKIRHILRRSERDMIKMCIGFHVRYVLLFLSRFNEAWIFSTDFRKIFQCQISWKSVRWEPICSMRKDGWMGGRTYVTKLIVAFQNFAKEPKI